MIYRLTLALSAGVILAVIIAAVLVSLANSGVLTITAG
jgi:hypothetical protein